MAKEYDVKRALAGDKNLIAADLTGADLRYAKLSNSFLAYAKLQGADLRRADLRESNLDSADLTGADLRHARLRHARLQGANLTGANLKGANLPFADLTDADLTDAEGIPLSISDKFPHKGETAEEKARKGRRASQTRVPSQMLKRRYIRIARLRRRAFLGQEKSFSSASEAISWVESNYNVKLFPRERDLQKMKATLSPFSVDLNEAQENQKGSKRSHSYE